MLLLYYCRRKSASVFFTSGTLSFKKHILKAGKALLSELLSVWRFSPDGKTIPFIGTEGWATGNGSSIANFRCYAAKIAGFGHYFGNKGFVCLWKSVGRSYGVRGARLSGGNSPQRCKNHSDKLITEAGYVPCFGFFTHKKKG